MADFWRVNLTNNNGTHETVVIGNGAQVDRFADGEAFNYGGAVKIEFIGRQLPDDFSGKVLNLT